MFQQELLSEKLFHRNHVLEWTMSSKELFSEELFQRNSFLRNCLYKTSFNGITHNNSFFCSVNLFQETVSKACFYYCLNHISKPYLQTSFQETVSKACFLLSNYHSKKPFPRPVFYYLIIIPRNRFQGLFFII